MSANSEGSGETALMRSLARAFAGRQCDKAETVIFISLVFVPFPRKTVVSE